MKWLLLLGVVAALVVVFGLFFMAKLTKPVSCASSAKWTDYAFASGDLLLFSGSGMMGSIGSAVLKLIGTCPYTHVAMLYENPKQPGDFYVWEMTAKHGTHLPKLEDVMAKYRGQVVVRPLVHHSGQRGVADNSKLRDILRAKWGKVYAYDFWLYGYNRILNKTCPLPAWCDDKHRDTRFCCDLISETYNDAGVLDYHCDPDAVCHVIPKDFAQKTQNLPVHSDYRFGDEVLLKK